MNECEKRYPWDAANASIDRFQATMLKTLFIGGAAIVLILVAVLVFVEHENIEHRADYGLGATVATTMEYEALTGDSFTGVVVRTETCDDPALTILNRDGTERRIATRFLEPVVIITEM